ncbi:MULTISPECIES: alpha/beta hydrolase [Streptomyces]|uniref:Alpha/beta hydrolase n=1 Tax=Streptomyces venezuelae TaxID=54571 RepID=A0A5P2BM15_STRVZ|nr:MULTISPECIES: alpha/beta hydrolase [Streptomyces]NEA05861.1 alpha/beta hydrolase [Streptomyces sp. SID10116]MYY85482.1 alpha/beta fold hydrolase [Streptomyces sp. SID335]MYZ17535.1 alpha/beta fold hydrolase [Streptomyces sp. SID337]NDZ89393.1 alpha/beta hydrolase [Streptomyces sp. SID10115]NEB44174.1 alpha/beta hydrolase [Streptomyces sp. SID339]
MNTAPRATLSAFAATLALAAGVTGCATSTDDSPTEAGSQANTSADNAAYTATLKGLDRYYQQRLDWGPCKDPELTRTGTQCAKVTVPLDYAAPKGPTLSLTVSRMKATGSDRERRGIIQTNPGGPGGHGLGMPAQLRAKMTPRVAAAYDVIGMDTRGLGESSPLDCGLDSISWFRGAGFDRASFDRVAKKSADDARKCNKKYGDRLAHYSTRNIARDVDVIRGALGERKTSWFGQSYGTYLGAVYANMFPDRVDRLVLDSAMNPRDYGLKMFQAMGPANEKALDDLARWAAPRDGEYHLGKTPAAVRATVEGLVRRAAQRPIQVGGDRLDHESLPFVLYFLGTDDIDNAEYAKTVRLLLDAAAGRTVEPSERLAGLLGAMFRTDETGTGRDYASALAVLCADTTAPGNAEWYRKAIEKARPKQPVFGPFHNAPMPCGWWKAKPSEAPTKVSSDLPALQIQATGDTRTTYEQGLGMHKAMRGSKLVTVPVRTHAVFVGYPNACADKAVNDYLLTGELPSEDYTCPRDQQADGR